MHEEVDQCSVDGIPEEHYRRQCRSAAEGDRPGADLRIYTGFQHNEHIDTRSDNDDLIQEVSDFPCTWLLDDRWAAGIMTFRQPVQLLGSFGRRASMSFFMYNQNGLQSIARPYLDGTCPFCAKTCLFGRYLP